MLTVFRDGIRFRNGKQVLLQEITEGARFEVLSLASSQHETEAEPRPGAVQKRKLPDRQQISIDR